MKTVKLLIVLISFTFMSTGCRHDHHDHGKKSSKTDKASEKDAEKRHRH